MAGLNDNQLIVEAKRQIDFSLKTALLQPTVEWVDPLVMRTTSSTYANLYPMSAGLSRLREWRGERVYENFRRSMLLIANRTFEKSIAVAVNDMLDDQLGGYDFVVAEIARQAKLWPQDLVVAAIQAGESALCFDGQSFFNASHPTDFGNTASSVTYSNIIAAKPLQSGGAPQYANVAAAIGQMRGIVGRDGRPLGFGTSGKIALIVPPALEMTARQVCGNTLINGGETNYLFGIAQVIVAPDLQADPTTWYIADIGSAVKPLIFQMRQDPQSSLTAMVNPNDPNVFEKDEYRWGVKARGAAGYGMPFLMAKVKAV